MQEKFNDLTLEYLYQTYKIIVELNPEFNPISEIIDGSANAFQIKLHDIGQEKQT